MAIAKKPNSNHLLSESNQITPNQQAFISKASESSPLREDDADQKKVPVMLRIDPAMLKRIDLAAKELGLKRAGFILSSAAERLKRMES